MCFQADRIRFCRKGSITKMAAKRPKKGKLSKRVPAALARYMKKLNPAKMKGVTKVRMKKFKDGGFSVRPAR